MPSRPAVTRMTIPSILRPRNDRSIRRAGLEMMATPVRMISRKSTQKRWWTMSSSASQIFRRRTVRL